MNKIKPATNEEVEEWRNYYAPDSAGQMLIARIDLEIATVRLAADRADRAEQERDAAIAELGAEGRRRGQAVAAAEADASAARRQVQRLREALAQAKAQIVTAAVADERNRYGYRTDMALWANVALQTIDEALGHE